MKRSKILPGAAGIIALTATIGFVGGRSESEAESISRNRITPVMTSTQIASKEVLFGNLSGSKSDSSAYLVEFRRRDTYVKVLIDAESGQLLLRLREG
jgi:hypothetical protein